MCAALIRRGYSSRRRGARHRGIASSRSRHDAADRVAKAARWVLRIEFHFVIVVAELSQAKKSNLPSRCPVYHLSLSNVTPNQLTSSLVKDCLDVPRTQQPVNKATLVDDIICVFATIEKNTSQRRMLFHGLCINGPNEVESCGHFFEIAAPLIHGKLLEHLH